MSNTLSGSNSFYQGFGDALGAKLSTALPEIQGKKFIACSDSGGFNYGITYGNNAYYNEKTLLTVNSTIDTDPDGVTSIRHNNLSNLYRQVLESSAFTFSQKTRKQLNEWDNASEAQIQPVLSAFENSGFKFSDPLPAGGKIADVFDQLTGKYGPVSENCDNLPPYLTQLKDALSTYIELSGEAYNLHSRAAQATAILNAAKNNTKKPCKTNNGLQTGDGTYYVGFDKLPLANKLIGSLSTKSRNIKMHFSGSNFNGSDCSININSSSSFAVSIAGLLDIDFSHKSNFSISSYVTSQTDFEMDITYDGITAVPVIPRNLSSDNKTGWYADNILRELKEKSNNPDTDGYKLQGSEFSVDELFGYNGRLNYFNTLVISREPTVDVTFTNVNISEMRKHIDSTSSVAIHLFGFIPIGTVSHSYRLDNVSYSDRENSVTMHFEAPDISGTIPLEEQTANIMGGVPQYTD